VAEVSVSIDDAHLPVITSVAQALQARGMQVEQVLDAMGIITGSVADDRRPLLEAVPGVAAVVDGLAHQLSPPNAEVQ